MNRRQFIASVGATVSISSAGCGSDSSTNSPSSDTTQESENLETTAEPLEPPTQTQSATPASNVNFLIDDTIELPEGGSSYVDFSVSSPVTVEYDFVVQNDVNVDLFIVSLRNFERYQSGQSFSTIQTVDGSEAMGEVRVSRGNYYVILDHSEKGPTSPPGQFEQVSATVDATISYVS